jgi:hypothetical protein
MYKKLVILPMLACLSLLTACSTVLYHGGQRSDSLPRPLLLFLPPFFNATDDDHAARALTELTATALFERGLPVIQTEPSLLASRAEKAAGSDGLYAETARSLGATHLLIGTIHEYRYKTDLDGDPAVGVTMRLVDAQDGRTIWQGSAAKVSVFCASLSTASQRAVRQLVKKIPIAVHPVTPAKR